MPVDRDSCVHTAFSRQEAIATSLEQGDKCIGVFSDVAKAFDDVWIDCLFEQVFGSGVTGKTWRLLYCKTLYYHAHLFSRNCRLNLIAAI